jgi:hypothetical protein
VLLLFLIIFFYYLVCEAIGTAATPGLCFTLASDRWFAAQPKEFFFDELKNLEQRSHKCVELRGEYLE